MRIDAFTCDFCEEFGTEFSVKNEWFTILFGVGAYHLCCAACLQGWVENDSWRVVVEGAFV